MRKAKGKEKQKAKGKPKGLRYQPPRGEQWRIGHKEAHSAGSKKSTREHKERPTKTQTKINEPQVFDSVYENGASVLDEESRGTGSSQPQWSIPRHTPVEARHK